MFKARSVPLQRIFMTIIFTISLLTSCTEMNNTDPVQEGQKHTSQTESVVQAEGELENERSSTEIPIKKSVATERTIEGRVDCYWNDFGVGYFQPIAFSADGQHLACYKNFTLKLYQINPLKLAWKASVSREYRSMTFSPDGAYLGIISEPEQGQNTLDIYDAKNGNHLEAVNIPEVYNYTSIAFSPDSQLIAVDYLARKGYEGYYVLDWKSGEIIQSISQEDRVGAIFSADGKRFIIATASSPSKIFDTTSWKEIPLEIEFQPIMGEIIGVAANGTWVYQKGSTATLVRDDKMVFRYGGLAKSHNRNYAISFDGKWYASQGVADVTICNLTTGEQIDYSRNAMGNILKVAFTPRGTLIGVTGRPEYVEIWEYDFEQ